MLVQRTLNTGVCMNIVHDDEIFEAISEDGAPSVKVDVIEDIWLEIIDEQIIGCVQLVRKTSQSFEAHIHILPKFRGKSEQAGEAIWMWITKHLTGVIYSTVPEYCKNVINYLRNFNFKSTGIIPMAWLKNNEKHDLIIMSREVK